MFLLLAEIAHTGDLVHQVRHDFLLARLHVLINELEDLSVQVDRDHVLLHTELRQVSIRLQDLHCNQRGMIGDHILGEIKALYVWLPQKHIE